MLLKIFRISKGQTNIQYIYVPLCVRLGKHLDVFAASASVAWASESAKNTQVEKRKLFGRRLYTVLTRGWKAFPVHFHGPDVK